MRIFLDRTVPPAKSDRVREVIADALIPQLRTHPQFARLAVLVSSDPRRGGWQVAVVALDPELTPVGDAEIPLDPVELDRLTTTLRQL